MEYLLPDTASNMGNRNVWDGMTSEQQPVS